MRTEPLESALWIASLQQRSLVPNAEVDAAMVVLLSHYRPIAKA